MFFNKKSLLLWVACLMGCDTLYEQENDTAASLAVSCTEHQDCESGVCNKLDLQFSGDGIPPGVCVPSKLVGYVDANQCSLDKMNGSKEQPYCDISSAIDFVSYIHVTPINSNQPEKQFYGDINVTSKKDTLIVGASGRDGVPPVAIKGVGVNGAKLWIDGFKSKSYSKDGSAFSCSNNASLHLFRSQAVDSAIGVDAKGCAELWVDKSYLARNSMYGLKMLGDTKNTRYHITNNLIKSNGQTDESPIARGGVYVEISNKEVLSKEQFMFAYNTVVSNGKGKKKDIDQARGTAIRVQLPNISGVTFPIGNTVVWDNFLDPIDGLTPTQIYCHRSGMVADGKVCDFKDVYTETNDPYITGSSEDKAIKILLHNNSGLDNDDPARICEVSVKALNGSASKSQLDGDLTDYFGVNRSSGGVDAGFCVAKADKK